MSQSNQINTVKDWFTFAVAIVVAIAGVIFWVQSASNHKFENVEKEISELKSEISKIREDNSKILRVVGRLEGRIGRLKNN
tara:strand:- start:288 stop:530 length:243 start_codon:yes stop_codon:yes gene_type:complete